MRKKLLHALGKLQLRLFQMENRFLIWIYKEAIRTKFFLSRLSFVPLFRILIFALRETTTAATARKNNNLSWNFHELWKFAGANMYSSISFSILFLPTYTFVAVCVRTIWFFARTVLDTADFMFSFLFIKRILLDGFYLNYSHVDV